MNKGAIGSPRATERERVKKMNDFKKQKKVDISNN